MTNPSNRTLLAAVALTSFTALLLELVLTRLFSVVLFYHFAFLAISIALLGLGAGGVFAYIARGWLQRFETRHLAAKLCTMNAAAIVFTLIVVLRVPVSLELSSWNFLRLTALYLAAAVPFFFTGLLFSVVFARESRHITRLYGADLVGGAAACLAIVPLLNFIGGPNTVLFAAFVSGLTSVVWKPKSSHQKSPFNRTLNLQLVVPATLLLLITFNYTGRLIDIVYAKGLARNRDWVEFAKWNAISRVEVDRQGGAKAIVIDADASTYIMNVDPHQWQGTERQHNLMSAPPALANVLRPRGEFAIIGPGGGVDVLRAVANGSPNVTGIEINPIIANTIMRGRYADYSYRLYEQPEVHIHVTDGRSFVRNASQQFDVVQMTLVDTWASTAAGAFALSENSLYTVEAFRQYFEHLKPDGMIAITRWEFRKPREALRVISVATEALHQLGIANPARHFIVVSEGALDEDGIPVVVLAKKSPFTTEEERAIESHLAIHSKLHPLYLPSNPGNNPFSALIASNNPWNFAQSYPYNVAPVTDNAPFFFFTLKTNQILHEQGLQQGIDWKVNLGVAVLGMVLLISLAAVFTFLIVPLLLKSTRRRGHKSRHLLYFVAVGLGYILIEIAFIQRFVLFLGHPTYALTVVIFLMLLSSGAGSLLSRRWLSHASSGWLPLVFIVIAVLAYVFVLPSILNALVGLPFAAKLLVSAALLVPLGLAMGMPFPTGLRALAAAPAPEFPVPTQVRNEAGEALNRSACDPPAVPRACPEPAEGATRPRSPENFDSASPADNAVEWAWAMNAASSVLGSVLAMVIAIHYGLNATLATGAAAYFLALLISRSLTLNDLSS
jgi:spermidine synthase